MYAFEKLASLSSKLLTIHELIKPEKDNPSRICKAPDNKALAYRRKKKKKLLIHFAPQTAKAYTLFGLNLCHSQAQGKSFEDAQDIGNS